MFSKTLWFSSELNKDLVFIRFADFSNFSIPGFFHHLKKVMDSPRSAKKAKLASGGIDPSRVARKEMCFYCFDVLYSNLHLMESPPDPKFSNES